MIVLFAGIDPRVGKQYVRLEATVGGWGAWDGWDGESALINNVNGSLEGHADRGVRDALPGRVTGTRFAPTPADQGAGGAATG